MVIALDGTSCAGKSTLSVLLAKKLGYHFLNTGMIFRAIAYDLAENKISCEDIESIEKHLKTLNIKLSFVDEEQHVSIDGKDVSKFLYSPENAKLASKFSQLGCVRNVVMNIQREFAKEYNIVVEGRDIGTEVFPDAKYKFYVYASIESRTNRRYETTIQNFPNITKEEIRKSLEERDYSDIHREISPLRKADDAVVIDTSNDTVEESLEKMLSYIKEN